MIYLFESVWIVFMLNDKHKVNDLGNRSSSSMVIPNSLIMQEWPHVISAFKPF